MTEQTAKNPLEARAQAGASKFKSIQEVLAEEGEHPHPKDFIRPTEAQVAAWLTEHPGAQVGVTLTLRLTLGKQASMPCLAAHRTEDGWEVLNVDGRTHRLALDEVA